jgi:asparagine synthase (glutamine-hydrolysing)
MTRQDVTVALSGEGADEIFAGYHWYRKAKKWRSEAARQGAEPWADYYRRRRQLSQPERLGLLADSLRHEVLAQGVDVAGESYREAAIDAADLPPMAALQAADFATWMADDLLPKVDRMSMAHSLEVRCPYLDHRLVEAVLPLADSFKVRWGRRKAVLRRIAAPYLPATVVKRKKHGFKVPVDRLMRTAFRPLVQDLTSAGRLKTQGLFSAEGVTALLRRWEEDPSLARHVWKIFCFQVWWEANGTRL